MTSLHAFRSSNISTFSSATRFFPAFWLTSLMNSMLFMKGRIHSAILSFTSPGRKPMSRPTGIIGLVMIILLYALGFISTCWIAAAIAMMVFPEPAEPMAVTRCISLSSNELASITCSGFFGTMDAMWGFRSTREKSPFPTWR